MRPPFLHNFGNGAEPPFLSAQKFCCPGARIFGFLGNTGRSQNAPDMFVQPSRGLEMFEVVRDGVDELNSGDTWGERCVV